MTHSHLQVLLRRAIHNFGLLKDFCNRLGTVSHQSQRNDNPKGIAQHKISPVVVTLRAGVGHPVHILIVPANNVVQHITIELAHADEQLERVSPGVVRDGGVGDEEGQRAPEEGGDGFHADNKGVLSHVARVGEGVLLPKLTEQVGFAGHVKVVVGEVA